MDLSVLTLHNLLIWLGGWTVVGFILMGEDKDQAVMYEQTGRNDRISERTLHEAALAGGFLGIIIGAKVFHHKMMKSSFWGPVVIAVLLWFILIAIILRYQLFNFS